MVGSYGTAQERRFPASSSSDRGKKKITGRHGKKFGENWEEGEKIAIQIGLDLTYYWSLTPRQFEKHIDVYEQKERQKYDDYDAILWRLGIYVGIAHHRPKEYPKKPILAKEEMSVEDMKDQMKVNAKIINTIHDRRRIKSNNISRRKQAK